MNQKEQEQPCPKPYCFFCAINESDPSLKTLCLARSFKEIPFRDDPHHVLVLTTLWNLAMTHPNDPEFPSLGIFQCMSKLILKGLNQKDWISKDQNIYIPYYAAHIIGSYTMNKAKFAEIAVNAGVILPLVELLKGKMSWVEQRVAVRALGHLVNHEVSFKKLIFHDVEIVESCINTASTCLIVVFDEFISKNDSERLKYHCDLLTRGLGGSEFEARKAEKWASQLQSWCLSLLDQFARKEKCLNLMCNEKFLKNLSKMWGGLINRRSPSGIGLIRTLCHTKFGRRSVAESEEVILWLCNTCRSSDEWQYMAIESLLLVLKDPDTRFKVIEIAALYLKDLVEMGNVRSVRAMKFHVGDSITQVLLQDYSKIRYGYLRLKSKEAEKALEETWDLKVERRKREKLMNKEKMKKMKDVAVEMKKKGNELFWAGDVLVALGNYTKALELCPLKYKKERLVLYSNRAQCHLVLKEAEGAVSDATMAQSLANGSNRHGKSLWRRAQAYDLMGLAKESLLDCLLFLECRKRSKKERRMRVEIPYYAAQLISKQMSATWLFAGLNGVQRLDNRELVGEDMDKAQQEEVSS